jgi:RNA polymerase sigma factor (sigma-70 family)
MVMKKLSDIEIIESVKRGNSSDYALLVNRYKDRAFSLLKRLLKNEMDAEEALQDSFLKAYNYLKDFRNESQFSTWFYRIVYNTALTVLSSRKRKIEQEMNSFDEEIDLGSFDNEIYGSTNNLTEYLLKMVDKLPTRNALVIILFYMDGLSMAEVSQVMGISLVNVKVLLHRSRNSLRDLLIKHNYQEELL